MSGNWECVENTGPHLLLFICTHSSVSLARLSTHGQGCWMKLLFHPKLFSTATFHSKLSIHILPSHGWGFKSWVSS